MARIANDVPVSLFSYSEITIERSSIKIIGRLQGSASKQAIVSFPVRHCMQTKIWPAEGDLEGIGAKGDTLLWLHSEEGAEDCHAKISCDALFFLNF